MTLEQATPTTLQHISFARRGATYFKMSGPGEFIAAAVLFALMIVIRVVNILRYRFDSDESQHLHVIWGWARGFVQYRDLFDVLALLKPGDYVLDCKGETIFANAVFGECLKQSQIRPFSAERSWMTLRRNARKRTPASRRRRS